MTTTLTFTAIRVNWDPVPAIRENGIITTYEILYDPQETFDGQIPNNVSINTTSGSVLNMTLTSLQEYVVYDITVRAYTSIGFGPYNPIGDSDRTLENGEYQCCLHDFYRPLKIKVWILHFYTCSSFCCS